MLLSANHVAVPLAILPGKTGPAGLVPGLTGTGWTALGSTDSASDCWSPGLGSKPPAGRFPVLLSLPQIIPGCRGTTDESASAATRSFYPAPQSAWSSDRRRSRIIPSIAATSSASSALLVRRIPARMKSIRRGFVDSSNGTPVPGPVLQAHWARCTPGTNTQTSVKQMILRRLSALEAGTRTASCATRCTL